MSAVAAPTFTSPVVSRVDVAWVCVATDDPSPLHLDEPFAQRLGHRSVVVPGTMLMGWVGQYFARWAGCVEGLRQWQVRFSAPVWPGDQLQFAGQVLEQATVDGQTRLQVAVDVTAQDGRKVARATALLVSSANEGVAA